MREIHRHVGGVSLALFLFLSGCSRAPEPALASVSQPDSLVQMIEQEIARKREFQQKVEVFRRRYLTTEVFQKIREYYPIIRKYSKRYGLDWRLIVAQILKESRFKENARSHKGAMGLMQIMPGTAREITRELDIEYIIKDPRENITAGIYHMYKQLQYFSEARPEERIKLALAAYNCGPARIFDAQDIARYKRLDPNTWAAVKQCLPLLTTDHWKLHLEVWPQGTPNYGYFYGYEETIDYVDDISEKYAILKALFKEKEKI